MGSYALIQDGKVWAVEEHDQPPTMHPEMLWVECSGIVNAVPGAAYSAGVFIAPPPDVPPQHWFVPYPRLCGRIRAAGKWAEFVAAKRQLPEEDQEYLATLEEGVANDDPKAVGFLHQIGLDPLEMLAP